MSSSWMACLLKSRSVIRFRGPETFKLLQGLVTNDLRSLENVEPGPKHDFTPNMSAGVTPPIYAAMLNPKGRFLYDLFFYRPPHPNEKLNRTGSGPGPEPSEIEIYADVDKDVIDVLLSTLKRYRLRLKVDIEDATGDFSCWQCFGEELSNSSASLQNLKSGSVGWGGTVDDIAVSSSGGNSLGWDWSQDPRLSCLGFRGIFPSNEIPPLVEADQETDERNFLLWRVQKGVAEGSTEIPKGEAVPLEYNLAGLNAISFDKGCYVGQELVARTHHRGEIRKRLLPLQFDNQKGNMNEQVTPGSEVVTAESQKKAGIVTTVVGSHGLGVLRLDEAFRTSEPLVIKDQENVQVKTFKPKWWPSEWLPDH